MSKKYIKLLQYYNNKECVTKTIKLLITGLFLRLNNKTKTIYNNRTAHREKDQKKHTYIFPLILTR